MRLLCVLLALCLVALNGRASAAAPLPAAIYAALPTGEDPSLSPDGTEVAMIGASGGKPAFVILHLDGTPPKVFSAGGWIPYWIAWKSPKLLVAGLRTSWKNGDGHVLANTKLLIMAADGSRIMPVDLSFAGGRAEAVPLIGDHLLSLLPGDPDHILLETTDQFGLSATSIDLRDGSRSRAQDSRAHVRNWYTDSNGLVRAGKQLDQDGALSGHHLHVNYLARADAADSWHTVLSYPADGTLGYAFAGFDPGDKDVVLFSADGPNDHRVIKGYHISTGQSAATVDSAPDADVAPMFRFRKLVGYVVEGTTPGFTYFDPALQHDEAAISRAIGSGWAQVLDRSADGRHVLAAVGDGAQPLDYWMLDRTGAKASLHPVIRNYEAIDPSQVAPHKWVSFTARDGMRIPALLTLPPGAPAQHLPFVILPHGGPSAHDAGGFDWLAQFIATRGYGVLQPQFRGSTGFGKALHDAGARQWGGAMQNDITDGTKYVISTHLADPARIAIVGASFGGYSALEGVCREPALYRAAAALAPVTNLSRLVGGMTVFAESDIALLMPGSDYKELESTSPVNQVANISVPVLIVHGRRDFTVPVEQTEMMAAAMKRAGKSVQTLYLPNADHFLSEAEDRLAWLNALQEFLAANIGPGKAS